MKWQPIATAPKDGTDIIVVCFEAGEWIVRLAQWVKKEEWQPPADPDEPQDQDGWWSVDSSVTQTWREPKHWIPLPELPENEY